MIYTDRIFGSIEIDEPVLLELLKSQAVQRLHGVLQHGITGMVGITRPTSRFEHSLGVFLLVHKLGGSLEEQIAALLHDVSHTAFSHVIDYVFGGHESQNYHEEKKVEYIATTDIPTILEAHSYDWCELLCLEDHDMAVRFPLLEQPAPAICADRLDYFLRDSYDLGLATHFEIELALDHLRVNNKHMVVDNQQVALWMGKTYIEADRASWANLREVGLYELAARSIRRGLDLGILTDADIWGTDWPAWKKLQASTDQELQATLSLVSPDTIFVRDETQPTIQVGTKLRTIDPDVLINGKTQPLSLLDPNFAHLRMDYLKERSGLWPIRVIPPTTIDTDT